MWEVSFSPLSGTNKSGDSRKGDTSEGNVCYLMIRPLFSRGEGDHLRRIHHIVGMRVKDST